MNGCVLKSLVLILFLGFLESSSVAFTKKNVIIICAHPDDSELTTGGFALLMKDAGFNVKFVSVTNGDKGHHIMTPAETAKCRYQETRNIQKLTGITYDVLDIPDGELVNNLENRMEIIRLIREWKADLVITHRPADYHPDHRNVSNLVQDAAFMVTVPHVLPSIPALKSNPVFMYTRDRFSTPSPFSADIVVDITPVIRRKAEMLICHVSQMFEWLPYINGFQLPKLETKEDKISYLIKNYVLKRGFYSKHDLKILKQSYSKEQLKNLQAVEAFEFSEYGKQISTEEFKTWFPFFMKK